MEPKYQVNLFSKNKTQSFIYRTDSLEEMKSFMGLQVLNPGVLIGELSALEESFSKRTPVESLSPQDKPGIVCGLCGGAVWDNTGKKTSPKSPDFRCKVCGAVAWSQKEGKIAWKEARPLS